MQKIEEIIDFIEETGDKCLIISEGRGSYVVLKVEEYKKLLNKEKKAVINDEKALTFDKPATDVKLYEIPRKEDQEDIYYPEPLED